MKIIVLLFLLGKLLTVVQQPPGDLLFVSSGAWDVTQWQAADQFGSTGLLAHNWGAGQYFNQLWIGQKVAVIYADGEVENFIVSDVIVYLPGFKDEDVIRDVYTGDYLVLQTCLGDGRLFIRAKEAQ